MDEKKRGRPKKIDSKSSGYRLRLDDECTEMLAVLSYESNKTKADILREALKLLYVSSGHY